MFWDCIAGVYDIFERIYNNRVIDGTAKICADLMEKDDAVLECACGTGLITSSAAPRAGRYMATDYSGKMLQRCRRKMKGADNIEIKNGNIMSLEFEDASFDKVIAGNVIHLLDDPKGALTELQRVTKPGGLLIIPTYINIENAPASFLVRTFNKMGANFKRQFSLESYKQFITDMGYPDAEYKVAEGRMPCAVAMIRV